MGATRVDRRSQSCPISFEKNAVPSQRTCNQVLWSMATSVDDNHLTACLTASSWLSAKKFKVAKGKSWPSRMWQSPATYSGMGESLILPSNQKCKLRRFRYAG
jgi:hypothetical protein